MQATSALDTTIGTHRELEKLLSGLIEKISATQAAERKDLTASFYGHLYRHFSIFHSAPAFYQLSMAFLQKTSSAVIAQAAGQLGRSAKRLPEVTLIAVSPAGRGEYSPSNALQLLLVHGELAASHREIIGIFCAALRDGFEAAGLAVDPLVTPSNPEWRGTLAEWQKRCLVGLVSHEDEVLINLCRLVDQSPLHDVNDLAGEFKRVSSTNLGKSYSALSNLVKRVMGLSNGLGLMGRLKLERRGGERGMFRLLDHGLLPFSASLSALALLTGSSEVSSCERIRDLLKRGILDVEVAKRMLTTWHILHGLRLWRAEEYRIERQADNSACLNPKGLTDEQRQSLIDALESVAIVQRHVEIIFSGIEE